MKSKLLILCLLAHSAFAQTSVTVTNSTSVVRNPVVKFDSNGHELFVDNVEITGAAMTDARPPLAHAASHASAGSDPVTLAMDQITGLVAALAGKSDTGHTHTFASLTSKPTTIAGYGITDLYTLGDARWALLAHTHTGADISGIDISEDTNLTGTSNEITLTGDVLSLHSAVTRDSEWDTAAEINGATTDADFVINGTNAGAVTVTAGGTDQNITLSPSGTGYISITGTQLRTSGSVLDLHVNGSATRTARINSTSLALTNAGIVFNNANFNLTFANSSGIGGNATSGVVEINSGTTGTFRDLRLRSLFVSGSTSGFITLSAPAVAGSGTVTLPLTGTLATLAGTETLSNKTHTGEFRNSGTVNAGYYNDGTFVLMRAQSGQDLALQTNAGAKTGYTLFTSGGSAIGGATDPGDTNLKVAGTVAASNLSGTNTGDQTITLTGDVTGSGTGSFATTTAAAITRDAEWDTLSEIETATGTNIIQSTEIDTVLEINTLTTDNDVATLAGSETLTNKTLTTPAFSGVPTGTVTSGSYTPTLTNSVNVTSSGPSSCQYLRVGNTVTVSGRVDLAVTAAATSTVLRMTLPIAADLVLTTHLAGTAVATAVVQAAAIYGDSTNDVAIFEFISGSSTASQPMFFTFTYRIP